MSYRRLYIMTAGAYITNGRCHTYRPLRSIYIVLRRSACRREQPIQNSRKKISDRSCDQKSIFWKFHLPGASYGPSGSWIRHFSIFQFFTFSMGERVRNSDFNDFPALRPLKNLEKLKFFKFPKNHRNRPKWLILRWGPLGRQADFVCDGLTFSLE